MSGPWIKVEHATIDKPEVARIAELLGKEPEYALGLVVRFWVWFDQNARDGVVTPCYAKALEGVMRCPGFVAAMTDVAWLHLDEKTRKLTISHSDRHNTNTAKTRALTQNRMRKMRDAPVTNTLRTSDAPVTRTASPDKIRLEVESKVKDDVDVRPQVVEPPKPEIKGLDISKAVNTGQPRALTKDEQLAAVAAAKAHPDDPIAAAKAIAAAAIEGATKPPARQAKAAAKTQPPATTAPPTSPGAARLAAMQAGPTNGRTKAPKDWNLSEDGITLKAHELGITMAKGETFKALRDRCMEAMGTRTR